jgi:hypothetical protein
LVGFYDPNQENADKISKEFGYKHFSTIATLFMDVIDIVTQPFPITNVQRLLSNQANTFLSKNPFQTPLKKQKLLLWLMNIMLRDKWDMWNDLILHLSQLKT